MFQNTNKTRFTPVLAEFYSQLQEEDPSALEIVFVSSDRDQSSFDEYYGEMPWISLPYSERAKKDALASKYGVRGIPMFIVLDADGQVRDSEGRSTVAGAKGDTGKAISKWAEHPTPTVVKISF